MESNNRGGKETIDSIGKEVTSRACPSIDGALPAWPSRIKEKAEWIGLHKENFIYTHHSSHENRVEDAKAKKKTKKESQQSEEPEDIETRTEALFCVPFPETQRLLSILKNSKGGSILVTGYRGTGKSSLVNYTISRLVDEKQEKEKEKRKFNYVPIRINLSTSRNAMALVMMMIKELYHCTINKRFDGREFELVSEIYAKFIATKISQESSGRDYGATYGAGIETSGFLTSFFKGKAHGEHRRDISAATGTTFMELPYTLHEAQQDLHRCLKDLCSFGYKVIFILDELDKLTPPNTGDPASPYSQKLIEIQTIVSDLKFLLTEATAFHIFIAGKDVDDSWQEDQNKGEGLFESIFVQNIYLPSTFTAKLLPAMGPHKWIEKLYALCCAAWDGYKNRKDKDRSNMETALLKILKDIKFDNTEKDKKICEIELADWTKQIYSLLLNELGVSSTHWTYNTGLLILPNFSESELFKLFLRYYDRDRKNDNTDIAKQIENLLEKPGSAINGVKFVCLILRLVRQFEKDDIKSEIGMLLEKYIDIIFKEPMTERKSRRIHYLLQYLTYKGRGIPRKILREFYALVQHRSVMGEDMISHEEIDGIDYIIYEPTALRQKIKFFSNIVMLLENNRDVFRFLNDKGCVATFHIIDYILKFYQTGFTWSDIESASFMTQREELFPSRQLVDTILEILEGHIITRIERRHKVYGLLPRVKHDLAGLYLAFGPEQIELRFTMADFSREIDFLTDKIQKVENAAPDERLESFKTQLRVAKLHELLGNSQVAINEYSKALRWIRTDINRMIPPDKKSPYNSLNNTAIVTYLSIAVDTLQKLGYLYEKNSEFNQALHYYQSAICLIESIWKPELNPDSRILGDRMIPVKRGKREPVTGFDGDLEILIKTMVPENPETVKQFSIGLEYDKIKFLDGYGASPWPVNTAFEPVGLPNIINSLAVIMEKLWHRCASNRFMLLGLDLYRSRFDEHKIIEQMVFIGEMHMRRRDIRLAAAWYLMALRRLGKYQKCDSRDISSKQTAIRSTTRAKLFDYLGDIYFATDGTALLDRKKFNKNKKALEKLIFTEVNTLNAELELSTMGEEKVSNNDDDKRRAEEYFYTQAAYHYGINHHTLRVCEVFLKKLVFWYERFVLELLSNNIDNAEEYWSKFWQEAEKILNILLDTRPNTKKIRALGRGRVINQRRFGELFTMVGRMFIVMGCRNLEEWYPNKIPDNGKGVAQGNGSGKKRNNEARRIDWIIGHLIDNEDFGENGRTHCADKSIGNRSPLWNLASPKWREIYSKSRVNQQNEEMCDLTHPNAFIVGQLYGICERILKNPPKSKEKKIKELKYKISMLQLAELSLLSAHLALDDNLRDLESAHASHRLGVLYLNCIETLLELRSYLKPKQVGNPKQVDEPITVDGKLALVYSLLHLASRRFLINAIFTYQVEHRHERCTHNELGRTYRALGDLLVIRAEILEFAKEGNGISDRTFNGLDYGWEELLQYVILQRAHIDDDDCSDVRLMAAEYYRNACRQYLSEIETYLKRYRFPTNVYYMHKDIMDEKMHFEISRSIYMRHWDFFAPNQKNANDAASELKKMARDLAEELYKPLPRVRDRQEWLQDLNSTLDLVNKMNPTVIRIKIVSPGNNDEKKECIVRWEVGKSMPGENSTRRFFRSLDDGLGVKLDDLENQGSEKPEN